MSHELKCCDEPWTAVTNDSGDVEINVYSICYDIVYGCPLHEAGADGDYSAADGDCTCAYVTCNLVETLRGEYSADAASERMGSPMLKVKVGVYSVGGVKKATTLVFGEKDADVMAATGANEGASCVLYEATLNVLRMINRSVLSVKASY